MGEYEERYPEAYGRSETAEQPTPREEVLHPTMPRQVRDDPALARRPAAPAAPTPAAPPRRRFGDSYRGVGPRGYTRSPERIYEDICDRLTENPFIDASDIEVRVGGTEVVLTGAVDSNVALRQAEAIAEEVAGVSHVHNRLRVGDGGERREPTAGDQVNRAMGAPAR